MWKVQEKEGNGGRVEGEDEGWKEGVEGEGVGKKGGWGERRE